MNSSSTLFWIVVSIVVLCWIGDVQRPGRGYRRRGR